MKRIRFTSLIVAAFTGSAGMLITSVAVIVWPVWATAASGFVMGLAVWFLIVAHWDIRDIG